MCYLDKSKVKQLIASKQNNLEQNKTKLVQQQNQPLEFYHNLKRKVLFPQKENR